MNSIIGPIFNEKVDFVTDNFLCVVMIRLVYWRCVWIEFIFTEIKNWNWKHCSKIIFKCVNSAVRSIFNKKIAEKGNLWDRKQCMNALFTVDKVNYCGLNQKKRKKKKRKMQLQNVDAGIISIQTVTELRLPRMLP